MHVYYVFGLLLIFLLSVSYSYSLATEDNYWKNFDDGEDDYDDYSSDEKQLENKINTNATNNIRHILRHNSTKEKLQLESTIERNSKSDLEKTNSIVVKCPDNCDCDEELLFVNCSNKNFEVIPKMLPVSLIELDISNNFIEKMNKEDLDYLVNLRKILLNNNEIKSLNEEIFINNTNLQTINLATNKITEINPNIFSKIPSLSVLDLSNNAIKIPRTGSFLNAPELEILILRNCSIYEVYDDTFKNTSGLLKLMLDKNDFNKKINIRAFNASMQNLVKLTLPELEQSYILELCQILKSIDNISFKNFDLSCFEMVAGLSFNESLISSGTQIPLFHESSINQNQNHISNQKNLANTTRVVTRRPLKNNMNITNGINSTEDNYENSVKTETDESVIQISSEIINYCLFAIMGMAVIGLIIGIICRKDVYGIKTKLCRTKKTRGPAKTDQIKPTEEIPLNKV